MSGLYEIGDENKEEIDLQTFDIKQLINNPNIGHLIQKLYKIKVGLRQKYLTKPCYDIQIQGLSALTVWYHMTDYLYKERYRSHPHDIDDWERIRALLLWYPEWKSRINELSSISKQWKNLVENWETIESLYENDYKEYGNKAFGNGSACQFIRKLVKCDQ
jgi:hypothetical protein